MEAEGEIQIKIYDHTPLLCRAEERREWMKSVYAPPPDQQEPDQKS